MSSVSVTATPPPSYGTHIDGSSLSPSATGKPELETSTEESSLERPPVNRVPSDTVYAENRFGELGRADTFNEEPDMCDRIVGSTEQFLGSITGNQRLHDRGVLKKSPSPARR